MTTSPKSSFVESAKSFAGRVVAPLLVAGAATACTVVPAYPGIRVLPPRIVVTAPVYVPAPVAIEPAIVVPYGEVVVIGGYAGPCRAFGGCYGHRPIGHFRR